MYFDFYVFTFVINKLTSIKLLQGVLISSAHRTAESTRNSFNDSKIFNEKSIVSMLSIMIARFNDVQNQLPGETKFYFLELPPKTGCYILTRKSKNCEQL